MVVVTNEWDSFCNLCILILENMSRITGKSYGFLNVLLFVVLEPLAIIMFMCSSLAVYFNRPAKFAKTISALFFIAGILISLSVIILVAIATLTLK